jgi:hypothetical protein
MHPTGVNAIRDQVTTWEVHAGLDELYVMYSRALNASVARRCLMIVGQDRVLAARVERLVDRATTSTWTTPGLAFAHHIALVRPTKYPITGWALLELEASLFRERPTAPSTSPVRGSEPWVRYALDALRRQRRPDEPDWTLEVAVPSERERACAADAIGLLELAWSPMADAVRSLVRQLVWVRTTDRNGIRSGSLPEAHGGAFVRAGTRPVAMAHALVCEVSNLDLAMRETVDKLLVNFRDRAPDFAHPAERTLGGVLAGALGAARASYAMARCAEYLRGRDREDALARGDEARAQLSQSIDVLLQRGNLTRAGECLVGSLAQRVTPASA